MEFNESLRVAAEELSVHDPVLAHVIQQVGPCTLQPHTNYYEELIRSIISQQLSISAAASIVARLKARYGGDFPSPETLLIASPEELREVGLSRPKMTYVKDLAQHIVDRRITFEKLDIQSNEEILAELTQVKGIGEWTVHMFLIFSMGRLNVLPSGDLGIKNGIRKLYSIDTLPSPRDIMLLSQTKRWAPYESVASWYVWQSLKLN